MSIHKMASPFRLNLLRHVTVPVSQTGSKLGAALRSMSSHGDDHLDKEEVISRVLDVVKSFPKVDPSKMANEEQGWETVRSQDEMDPISEDAAVYKRNVKRKRILLDEAKKANKRGVCYLSRIPPHMDPSILRQMLSQHADVERIYLAPEDSIVQVHRKRSGKFRGQGFSEGWVEFKKRSGAKRVANMLNGEQIGGRKRSTFYYDIWNIKYLSKFKWDDLTSEKAEKNATQVQKLALETSAAKKERQFYINNLNKSIALKSIKERMKKKQKVGQDSREAIDDSEKVIRQYHQKNPIADDPLKNKNRLPKSFLQGIFGGSSDSRLNL